MSILQLLTSRTGGIVTTTLVSGDPSYADVVMFLKIDESTDVITDVSPSSHALTNRRGPPTITNGADPFGGTSDFMTFVNDSIDFPVSTALQNLGTYTIEFWAKPFLSQTTYSTIVDASTGNQTIWIGLGINGAGTTAGRMNWRLTLASSPLATALKSSTAVNDNTWRYFAFVKDGDNAYLFVDGILEDSRSGVSSLTSEYLSDGQLGGSRYNTGTNSDNYYNGSILDFRVTKGVARYTSNFTPPTAPLPSN